MPAYLEVWMPDGTELSRLQHLLKLYDTFGIDETGERRRVRLANEALCRGAVTLAEVRAERPS